MNRQIGLLFVCLVMGLVGCTSKKAPLGTAKNPIKIYFVPSVDAKMLADTSRQLRIYLENHTPYRYQISVPQSFIAVVEAFGTKRADVAAINTYGYVMAHEKYQAEARLTVVRHGSSTYRSQFIARKDGPIKTLKDLAGKKVAYVDPASMSGYMLPRHSLDAVGVKPKDTVFAMKHDNVVTMIYNGQVDAGATFYSPPHKDEAGVMQIEDARRLVKTQYPDIEEKIGIVALTGEIPNDPIIFRQSMDEEMKEVITEAFLKFVATTEGKEAFFKMYGATELKRANDQDYDGVIKMLQDLNIDVSSVLKK